MFVWLLGGLGAIFVLPVFAGAVGLALYGSFKWKGSGRLAALVPVVSGVAAAIPAAKSGNLGPPFFIGGWYLFLATYALIVSAVRGSRAGRPARRNA